MVYLLAAACSDDATNNADVGGDVGDDLPAGPQTRTIVYHEPNAEGVCCGAVLEGVHVAIDRLSGRTELTTGADGALDVTLQVGESIDLTSALEGYILVTNLGLTYEDLPGDASSPIDVFMAPIAEPPLTVTLTVNANGAPNGGTFCASPGDFNYNCADSDRALSFEVAQTSEALRVTGTAWGLSGALVDFVTTEVTALTGDMSVTLEFDGELGQSVEELRFRVDLPPNESSPLRQNLFTGAHFPVIVYDTSDFTHIGATGNVVAATDDEWLLATVRWAALPELEPFFLAIALSNDGNYRSLRYFEERPLADAFYTLLDVPVVVSHADGGNLGETFTWTDVPDAQGYRLTLSRSDTGAALWTITTPTPSVDLPALPTGYDPSADWPVDGAPGSIFVGAFNDPDADIAADLPEPLRRDLQVGQSLATRFTWTGL